jgi:Na+-translocating ferredoxin:NAD+ oxidoreductase subunit C
VRCWRRWRRAVRQWRTGESASNGRKRLPRPRLRLFLNRYPQAEPSLLLHALFGSHLPVGAAPVIRNCLVVDPVICWALGQNLRTGWRFTQRPVQLFLQDCPGPRLVMARLGETVAEFCRRHGVNDDLAARQVIVNGMLAGRQVRAGTERINADTETVTVREPVDPEDFAPCLSCGWCIDVCPTGLSPVRLMEMAQSLPARPQAPSRAAREALHCLGCGLCSYVCPTRLPLMEMTLALRSRLCAPADKPNEGSA